MNPSWTELAAIFPATWAPVVDALARATVLLAVTGVASVLLRRASAATRHLVWTLGLVSALLLPVLTVTLPRWELPIVTFTPASPKAVAQAENAPNPMRPAVSVSKRERHTGADQGGAAAAPAALPAAPVDVPWTMVLLAIWGAGTVAILGRLLLGHIAVRWIFRRSEPVIDAPWLPLAHALARAIGVPRAITFLRSPRATMPMACGLVRPVVLMPQEADDWPNERLRIVLLHELAHVKRRDCLTHAVAQVACAAYWFNPLVWIAARRLRSERERACDDLVLAAGTRGSDYAEQLLEMARVMRAGRMPALVSGASLAMAHRSQLEGRLMAILDPGVPRSGLTRVRAALATAFVTVALLTVAAVQPWAYGELTEQVVQTGAQPPDAPSPAPQPQPNPAPRPPAGQPRKAFPMATEIAGAVADGVAGAAADGVVEGIVHGALQGTLEALAGMNAAQDPNKPASPQATERTKADPRLIEALTAALKDVDAEVREAAMHALVQLRDPAVFEPLVEALKDSAADIREQAAHGLGQLRDRRAVGPLTGALKDENPSVREQVVFALGQLRDPSTVSALVTALKDVNADVREQVVFALGQLRDPSTLDGLAAALRDENADVREQAAFALGQLRDRLAVAPLISALKDADADVREQAAFALGQIRDPGAVESLVFALRDSSADVREQAAFALGQLRDPRAIDGLTAALKDASASVRQQAAFALGQLAR